MVKPITQQEYEVTRKAYNEFLREKRIIKAYYQSLVSEMTLLRAKIRAYQDQPKKKGDCLG